MALTLRTQHWIPISFWAVITQPGGQREWIIGCRAGLVWLGTYECAYHGNAQRFPMSTSLMRQEEERDESADRENWSLHCCRAIQDWERTAVSGEAGINTFIWKLCSALQLSAIGRCSFLVLQLFVLAEQWSLRGLNVSPPYFLKT